MFTLTTATFSAAWRTAATGVGGTTLMSAHAATDAYGRRMVARAKWRYDLTMGRTPSLGTDEATYIANACQVSALKGFCFVAADEIAEDLTRQGATAKCVRVQPKKGGGDHYFTVVKMGGAKTSLIVDATWLQFSMNAAPFCLVGTLAAVQQKIASAQTTIDLVDAYGAGLKVVDRWDSYNCFT